MRRRDQREAAELLRRLLSAVDDDVISAKSMQDVALLRRLEGALLGLEAQIRPEPER